MDAPTTTTPREPASMGDLLRRCWKLIAVTLILGLHSDIDTQINKPYFFSRVSCCGLGGSPPTLPAVADYAGHDVPLEISASSCTCDMAKTFGAANVDPNGTVSACSVPWLNDTSPEWSHSSYCRNFQYVQMEVQTLSTAWGTLQLIGALFCLPVFGKMADIYGRRSVFYWTTVMTVLSFFIFTADAAYRMGDWAILATAPLLATFSTHGAVGWAMTIDLVPDPVDQAKFFPIMTPILNGKVASVVGDIMSYFLLELHLTDYTVPWAVLSIVAIAICIFINTLIEETMPNPKPFPGFRAFAHDLLPCIPAPSSGGAGAAKAEAVDDGGYGFALLLYGPDPRGDTSEGAVMRRRYVRISVLSLFIVGAAMGCGSLNSNYLFGVMHFMQEELIYVSLATKFYTLIGTVLATQLLPLLGPYRSLVGGSALSCFAVITFITLPGKSGAYVSPLLSSVGDTLSGPAGMLYASSALQPSDLTRFQGALGVVSIFPAIFAGPAFAALFYGDKARMDMGFTIAFGMFMCSIVIMVIWFPRVLPPRAPPRGGYGYMYAASEATNALLGHAAKKESGSLWDQAEEEHETGPKRPKGVIGPMDRFYAAIASF